MDAAVVVSALALAALFTALVVAIGLVSESGSRFRATLCVESGLYLAIYLVGNSFGTFLALFQAPDILSEILGNPGTPIAQASALNNWGVPFLSAFLGVFAFQVVLSNTNITFFGKGVLTIDDWINKAKNAAVAKSADREDEYVVQEETELAEKLAQLDEQTLTTYLVNERADLDGIEQDGARYDIDLRLYKAQCLVAKVGIAKSRALLKGR